jgi:hypothetical protein
MSFRKSAELLLLAAEALDEHIDPFHEKFLTENEVTFDQCMSLSEQLAIGARMLAYGIEHPTSEQGRAMLLTMARQL